MIKKLCFHLKVVGVLLRHDGPIRNAWSFIVLQLLLVLLGLVAMVQDYNITSSVALIASLGCAFFCIKEIYSENVDESIQRVTQKISEEGEDEK